MQESERLQIYFERILDAITTIKNHTKNINITNIQNHQLEFDASLMQLIHIGEIMYKINKKFPNTTLENITMSKVIGFRNFAAHNYIGININIVKVILEDHLPILENAITQELKKLQK